MQICTICRATTGEGRAPAGNWRNLYLGMIQGSGGLSSSTGCQLVRWVDLVHTSGQESLKDLVAPRLVQAAAVHCLACCTTDHPVRLELQTCH